MAPLPATYFDGRTARAHAVTLDLDDGQAVVVLGDGVERREPMGAVTISDAVGAAPRFVRFADGAVCEIADPAFAGMVARSRLAQWEQSSWAIAAAVVFLAAVGALGIQFGLPAMANSAADRLPPDALDT